MSENHEKGWLLKALGSGAMFLAPLVAVCFLYKWCSGMADEWLGAIADNLIQLFIRSTPVNPQLEAFVSLMLFLGFLVVIGRIAMWKPGRRGLSLIDLVFGRIPIVKSIYMSVRKMVNAMGDSTQQRFQRVVLMEMGGGSELLGFVTAEVSRGGRNHLICWVPMTPNPTGGLLVLVPEEDATELDMTPDQAMNLVISMGMVTPHTLPLKKSGA